MTLNNRQSLLIGLGIGLLIAALVGSALTAFDHAGHKRIATAGTPKGEKGSATPEKSQPTMDSGTEPGSTVELTEDEQKAAGIQISEVRHQRLTTEVSAFGRVEEPESRLSTISARVAGRIDRLYLQYTGQNIQRGQAIADIYSPELLSASEEYKLALDSRNQLKGGSRTRSRSSRGRSGICQSPPSRTVGPDF